MSAIQNHHLPVRRDSLDDHLNRLARLRDRAEEADEFSAAIRAEELRGKAMGFYIERTMVAHVDLTREEIAGRIQMLSQAYPGLVESLNKDLVQIAGEVMQAKTAPGEPTQLLPQEKSPQPAFSDELKKD